MYTIYIYIYTYDYICVCAFFLCTYSTSSHREKKVIESQFPSEVMACRKAVVEDLRFRLRLRSGHTATMWHEMKQTKKRDPRTQGYSRAPFFSKSTMIHHDSMISFNTPPHGWYVVYWSDHPPMASFQRDKRGVSICPRHLSLAMHLHVVNLAPVGAIIVTHRAVAPNAGLPSHLTEFNLCPMTHWPPIKKWTMSMSETTKKSRIKHKTAHHPMKYITRCYGYSSKHLPRLYLALFSLVQTPSQMVLGSPG